MMGIFSIDDTKSYSNFVRMDHDMFEEMMGILTPRLQEQDTNKRRALETEFKLAITLAICDSYMSLGYGFRVALNTICSVLTEVCQRI